MKTSIPALLLFLAMCRTAGHAQTITPSIVIGIHALTLGMQESTVLEQLGTDLELQHLPGSASSSWLVSKKVGSIYKVMGNVTFDGHKLTTAIRYWEIEKSSSSSLFYAISDATKSLEHEGLTTCRLFTYGASQMIDAPTGGGSASLDTKEVLIDCGTKQIKITLHLSDAPGVDPSSIEVAEWLQSR